MRPAQRISAADIERSFAIKARRLKSELGDDREFYWFYVSLHLEPKPGASLSLSDVSLVEYHLLHSSFREPNVRVVNPANGFEYKFWLYGFIKVSANVVTRNGEVGSLPPTPIAWDVTADELKLNGKRELTW